MSDYKIVSTQPTIYQDPVAGVVNGVLVRFSIPAYNEFHEVRVQKMDVGVVKQAIEAIVTQRDELANIGNSQLGAIE